MIHRISTLLYINTSQNLSDNSLKYNDVSTLVTLLTYLLSVSKHYTFLWYLFASSVVSINSCNNVYNDMYYHFCIL